MPWSGTNSRRETLQITNVQSVPRQQILFFDLKRRNGAINWIISEWPKTIFKHQTMKLVFIKSISFAAVVHFHHNRDKRRIAQSSQCSPDHFRLVSFGIDLDQKSSLTCQHRVESLNRNLRSEE